MSKYEPLKRHLLASRGSSLVLGFADIEEIVGFSLPTSARRYAAWWSNSDSSHVQAQAWLAAGYETSDVDIPGERLTLAPAGRTNGFHEMQQTSLSPLSPMTNPPPRKRHPAWGLLKGTTIVAPGVDIAKPTAPDWGKLD